VNYINEQKKVKTIYYDSDCNLCKHAVKFVSKHSAQNEFRFLPLQSGSDIIDKSPPANQFQTLILNTGNKDFQKSAAVFEILKNIKGPWKLLYAFVLIPRKFRDSIYDFIARHRYKWFGRGN
jgi:predicted DCC family thiol-disulfide oxidoreductase YuxK